MKKNFILASIIAMAFTLTACNSILVDVDSSAPSVSSQSQSESAIEESPPETSSENIESKEYDIKQELKASIEYYKDVVTTKLSRLAKKEDSDAVISLMEEAISRLDADIETML